MKQGDTDANVKNDCSAADDCATVAQAEAKPLAEGVVGMIQRNRLTEKDVVLECEEFELRYSVDTPALEQAFMRDGRLIETEDFHRWSLLRSALELFRGRRDQLAEA